MMAYRIIKTEDQYNEYCKKLYSLLKSDADIKEDEIELLTLLVEKYDQEHYPIEELDPVQLIKALMKENNLKSKDQIEILGLSKGTISKMLNYQKGLSKSTIRILANRFKLKQEAFNRPYKLKNSINRSFKNASLMNTEKHMEEV